MWIQVVFYFAAMSIMNLLAFYLYGKCLMWLGDRSAFPKTSGSVIVFLVMASYLLSPLFLGVSYVDGWGEAFRSDIVFMIFVLSCFAFSLVPSVLFFRRHMLRQLQAKGFFVD